MKNKQQSALNKFGYRFLYNLSFLGKGFLLLCLVSLNNDNSSKIGQGLFSLFRNSTMTSDALEEMIVAGVNEISNLPDTQQCDANLSFDGWISKAGF